ncbi:MAG: DUF2193 family protein [Euryarchaeota archaeon]|nr:DUF2193 family protein [Euryarchaeota archaeon]
MSLIEKTVNDAIAAQNAAVDAIRIHRYEDFLLEHARPYVEVIRKMECDSEQSREAIDLYQQSLLLHYDILTSLTDTITPFDTAFLEWQQTPIVLEIMYELDRDFRGAVETFIETIDEADDIIGIEATRVHNGFYGVISSSDFAAIPGSVFNVLARIIERAPIEKKYKQTILAAKSWGLNGIYVFGDTYTRVLGSTGNVAEAIEEEKKALKLNWDKPVQSMLQLMGELGHTSYDRFRYFELYREKFRGYIERAYDSGVHPANIVMLPTHVGDIGHHIGSSYYKLCRDDMCMAILESVSKVAENTLKTALSEGKIKNPFDVGYIATGACASATADILAWDGFTPDYIQDMMQKRFRNFILTHPFDRSMVGELHVNDFLDFITRGERVNAPKPRGDGGKVAGIPIDLSPVRDHPELNHPEAYAYPFTAITVRATALLRFIDQPCLLAPEPPSIAAMVNAVALNPEVALAPVQMCKNCATARYLPAKCDYCMSPKVNSVLG